jgi:hypothetical protein
MSGSDLGEGTDSPEMLASMRQAGAHRFDPVHFHHLEALARRAGAQPSAVKRILEVKLARAVTVFGDRFEHARDEARNAMVHAAQSHPQARSDLQQLFCAGDFPGVSRFISTLSVAHPRDSLGDLVRSVAQPGLKAVDGPVDGRAGSRHEPKSVRYFRDTWSRLNAPKRVTQALGQAPRNAGPINSHGVVLRSLVMMREISPDYLNRFMSYVDSLRCLDQADRERQVTAKTAADAGKPKSANSRRVRSR